MSVCVLHILHVSQFDNIMIGLFVIIAQKYMLYYRELGAEH